MNETRERAQRVVSRLLTSLEMATDALDVMPAALLREKGNSSTMGTICEKSNENAKSPRAGDTNAGVERSAAAKGHPSGTLSYPAAMQRIEALKHEVEGAAVLSDAWQKRYVEAREQLRVCRREQDGRAKDRTDGLWLEGNPPLVQPRFSS
jgi:hypothetical protein